MKLRVTPLNLATAVFLFLAVYIWIFGAAVVGGPYQQLHLGNAIAWVMLLFAFVVFVLDLMLRNYFQETKKLWLIELSFVVLAAIIFLLVKR
ncbi:hypothetical protein C8P68_104225 [Mucilaginibacter yixingensis]|uniref:Uncharacterized protein n=1 Tax=Mucilaginibacter yixingensis TaxID=1295612 RepID=A0A2T5J9L0_9SPHI|nr:hypothetical protein [Mucilaginibacter yixingensis]PTQ96737.1 hypothetical protein C8P68_104225 [Mucilaginibacter yixingensis]